MRLSHGEVCTHRKVTVSSKNIFVLPRDHVYSFISDLIDFIRVTGEHLDHENTDMRKKDSHVPDTVPDITKSENGFLRLYALCVAVWVREFQGPAGDTSVWVRSSSPRSM